MLLAVVTIVVLAPVISPYEFEAGEAAYQFDAPTREHWLGTDQFGHDVLTRLLWGGRTTLSGAALATAVAFLLGSTVGAVSAAMGGTGDWLLMRAIDVLLGFPSLLLALALVAVFGTGVWPVALGVGISLSPGVARLVRSSLLALKAAPFIEASRALGASLPHIILRHLVPNVLPRIVPYSAVIFAWSLLSIASLEFLGLASSPSIPSWGRTMMDGRTFLRVAPWIALSSGFSITFTVIAALGVTSNEGRHHNS